MKLVIFDFDGVITNTYGFCYEIWKNEIGLTENEYRQRFEGNINKAVSSSPIDNFFDRYTPKLMECRPKEGIEQVIEKLSKTYILAIVSSTITSSIQTFLEKSNLAGYFSEILGNDINHSKVKKLQMVLDKFHITPLNAVYITDTLGDIKEAGECGTRSIGVTWGYHPIETLKRGNPDRIVNEPHQILDVVKKML